MSTSAALVAVHTGARPCPGGRGKASSVGPPDPQGVVEQALAVVGQAVERDVRDRVRGEEVSGGLDPAQSLLEAEEGEGPALRHGEDLAVENVSPRDGRERGHDLGELRREVAPVPREEPDGRVELVKLAADAVVLVLDPERCSEATNRVRPVGGRLGEHGIDGGEVGEPRGLEAAAARLERDRAQVGPMTVGGPNGRDRLLDRVGDGVLERLLLHADPRLAQHGLDERPDGSSVHPPKGLYEERHLGPRAPGGAERLEARRHVGKPEGVAGVARRGAGPELRGRVARVGVPAPGRRDRLVRQLRSRRPEGGFQRRASDR